MQRNAYLFLILTTLFWGGNAIAGKLAVGHISPMLLTATRWGFATVLLYAVGRKQLAVDWVLVRQNALLLSGLGLFGFTLFNVALYSALVHTSAINVSIEQAGIPMVIFIANFLIFRLRITVLQIVGFLLSIAGVVLTASHGEIGRLLNLDLNFGDALMLIAVVVYSGYTVALRVKPAIHWMSLMIVMTATAFVSSLPFVAGEVAVGGAIAPDGRGWAIILYTVLFPSILSQILYIRGVEMIGANRAGLFVNLVPIFGTIFSIVILREPFFTYHAIAIALVFGGIWLAETSGRRTAATQAGR